MTTKSDFTEEEWVRVRRAPFVAVMAISLADPGGPIEMAKESMATVKGISPDSATPFRSALACHEPAVKDLVAAKAAPEETSAFGQWLVATAQAAADAAKEGGFLGFGATQISEGEKDMIDKVRSAVAA